MRLLILILFESKHLREVKQLDIHVTITAAGMGSCTSYIGNFARLV